MIGPGLPFLIHQYPEPDEIAAYLDTHLSYLPAYLGEPFAVPLSSNELNDAIVALRDKGIRRWILALREAILEAMLRLNELPRSDEIWRNTNLRPTWLRVSNFTARVASEYPDDISNLLARAAIHTFNGAGISCWEELARRRAIDLAWLFFAAIFREAYEGESDELAEVVIRLNLIPEAEDILLDFASTGSPYLIRWRSQIRQGIFRNEWVQDIKP